MNSPSLSHTHTCTQFHYAFNRNLRASKRHACWCTCECGKYPCSICRFYYFDLRIIVCGLSILKTFIKVTSNKPRERRNCAPDMISPLHVDLYQIQFSKEPNTIKWEKRQERNGRNLSMRDHNIKWILFSRRYNFVQSNSHRKTKKRSIVRYTDAKKPIFKMSKNGTNGPSHNLDVFKCSILNSNCPFVCRLLWYANKIVPQYR